MSNKNSIKVCIKVRPCEGDEPTIWQVKEGKTIGVADSLTEPFVFDHVFDQDSTNQDVFDRMAKHIVQSCIDGFNGTIFAYGQTSSGKTYTMLGDQRNPGVMVLAAKEIFKQIAKKADRNFLVRVGYIEIYNEKIYDLLNKKNQDLKIHETSTGAVNVNCEECIITSEEDLLQFLCEGSKERTVGETNMNERSSRSHAIFRIIIESCLADRTEDAVIQSVLNLVDLAGSERADQTGARGARLKEGGHINKSLLFLSNVIKSLADQEDKKFISYRDSKLTRILQASLGGNAYTSIICTIKPSILDESQSTLQFALRAKKIHIKPQLNEIVSDATMMKRLQSEITILKDRLAEMERNKESQLKVNQLLQRIKMDQLKIISSHSLNGISTTNRRRTWGPASHSNGSANGRLEMPKPVMFPMGSHVAERPDRAPKTVSIFKSLDVDTFDDNEFKPAELHSFGSGPEAFLTPKPQNKDPQLSLTPLLHNVKAKSLEKVEKDFLELQAFTNLENQIDVKYDVNLKEKLDAVTARCVELEAEKLEYLKNKIELTANSQNQVDIASDLKEQLTIMTAKCAELEAGQLEIKSNLNSNHQNEMKRRCDALQAEIDTLTESNREANERIEASEQRSVNLEFEISSVQRKSKQREAELLTLLCDKDAEISKLKELLDEVKKEALSNTKEAQMRSMCQAIAVEDLNGACQKCVDLEQLLDEHKRVKVDFEKLTQEYERLQSNFEKLSTDSGIIQMKLNESELNRDAKAVECEELYKEITTIRAKLERVQADYFKMTSESVEKEQVYTRLNSELATAQADMILLQAKYDTLELTWKDQQQTLKDIQADFDQVQVKYEKLQQEYEKLEQSSNNSEEQCRALRSDNVSLQSEISLLKERVEEAQSKLMEVPEPSSLQPKLSAELENVKKINEELQETLNELQVKFNELQRENDDLSSQLMDNVQESDELRVQCDKLKEQINSSSLPCRQCSADGNPMKYSVVDSMKSSGVGMECSELECEIDIRQQFAKFTESLHEIELHNWSGSSQLFRSINIGEGSSTGYKLRLKSTKEIVALDQHEEPAVDETICLKGMLKQHRFQIIELSETVVDSQRKLRDYIAQLESDINEKNLIIDATEQTLKEMQEQMTSLESALLEKSMIVNQVEDYQRQIESLEKQNAEISVVCEELQEKVKECTMSEIVTSPAADKTLNGILNGHAHNQEDSTLIQLKEEIHDLTEQLQSKENAIEKLKAEIDELNEKHISLEVEHVDLQTKIKQQQQIINRLTEKSTVDAKLIDQLQEHNAEASECCNKAESFATELGHRLTELQSELDQKVVDHNKLLMDYEILKHESFKEDYQGRLAELQNDLDVAKSRQKVCEKEYNDELNRIKLEFFEKLELRETTFRENVRKYNLEWEASREAYEEKISQMMKKLAEKLSELESLRSEYESERIKNAEMSSLYAESKKLLDELCEKTSGSPKKSSSSLNDIISTSIVDPNVQVNIEFDASLENIKLEKSALELTSQNAHEEMDRLIKELEKQKAENDDNAKLLSQMKLELVAAHKQASEEKKGLEENIEELNLRKEELLRDLQEAKAKSEDHERLSLEYEQMKCDLEKSTEKNVNMEKQILNLEANLTAAQERAEMNRKEAQEKVETLNSKMSDLLEELNKANESLQDISKMSMDHEHTKSLLVESIQSKMNLEVDKERIEKELLLSQQENCTHSEQITKLQSELECVEKAKDSACNEQFNLTEKLKNLEKSMVEESRQFTSQIKELKSCMCEMQIKMDSLSQQNVNLQASNQELKMQLNNSKNTLSLLEDEKNTVLGLRERISNLEAIIKSLSSDLKSANSKVMESKVLQSELEEVKKSITQLESSKIQLTRDLEKQRLALVSKESLFKTERERLDGTISCLMSEKSNLEEKLCTMDDIVKKLESDLSVLQKMKPGSANASFESNASNTSPVPRKSLDRNICDTKKPLSLESEVRRNRRISTHDERRRQSYWNDTRDTGCMTDPVDSNCNCIELDRKLEDCKRNLFIRESQVTALNIELKNHPLKEENIQLKKRIEEEQEKARTELKRYKQKNQDLLCKVHALTTSANMSASAPSQNSSPLSSSEKKSIETQTESDMETQYNELVRVCRFRYNLIKKYEEKIKELESCEEVSMTSVTAGQIGALKQQCELSKKELANIREKYETAKRALKMRREEILQLREKVAKYEPDL